MKIEISKKGIFFLFLGFSALVIWAFILGIIVGQEIICIEESKPAEKGVKKEEKSFQSIDFSFYKRLEKTEPYYSIQVASFLKEKDAKSLVEDLRKKGYDAYYEKKEVGNKVYYRVKCGRFEDKKVAQKFLASFIKKEGIKAIVVKCR